jgi:hypothetical protein
VYSTTDPGEQVEKIMSFTRTEFEHGLERLTGVQPYYAASGYDLSVAAGGKPVSCTFEPQPDAVLGGLVRLPRVRVVVDMRALSGDERVEFLTRFEKTFQRGGG